MKIEVGFPPNIDKIREVFDLQGFKPVFTYGDTLYAPYGADNVTPDLEWHETFHMLQQLTGAEIWWDRYITDEEFRLEQELGAYGSQYAFYCARVKDRNARCRFLWSLAAACSSALYGNIIKHSVATKQIRIASGVKDKHYND